MTSVFALEYIRRRIRETGIADEYYLKWRHFVLAPEEVRKISAGDDIYLIVNEIPNAGVDAPKVRVESEFGIWDYAEEATNELIYEHRGKITLTSLVASDPSGDVELAHLQMIQVIPKNKSNNGNI